MGFEMVAVLAVLAGALVLFALEWFTADFVALCVMVSLMVLGLVTPEEGISGFSNPATLTVLAMFALSAGVYRTGAIDLLSDRLRRLAGKSETRQLLLAMSIVAPISAFLNNTAAVAILIPFATRLARDAGRSPSKFLMPLSFTSQLAGVVTLLGTSTNILASSLSANLGLGAFGIFEFSQIGLVVLCTGALYLLTVGRLLLPHRDVPADPSERFHLKEYLSEVIVPEGSAFVGETLESLALAQKFDVEVVEVIRAGQHLPIPLVQHTLCAQDSLIIRINARDLVRLQRQKDVLLQPERDEGAVEVQGDDDMVLSEVLIAPGSLLAGATLREVDFRNRYGASVLAMTKLGTVVVRRLPDTVLSVGDSLLLKLPARVLQALRGNPNFLIADEGGAPVQRTAKIPIAVGIVAGVVLLAAFGVLPILVSALAGALLMVLTGCLRVRELHQAIRWDVIFLLAGIIPLGIALEKTGTASAIAGAFVGLSQHLPPVLILGAAYLLAMLLTELISNTATIVLLVPIVAGVAASLGLDPKAFVLAVMFAASTSFSTPVGYQTNAMVLGPGGYKFFDFTRVGAPLNLTLWVVTTLAIAWLWGL